MVLKWWGLLCAVHSSIVKQHWIFLFAALQDTYVTLCCSQQHCEATLNISVCRTARHIRYIVLFTAALWSNTEYFCLPHCKTHTLHFACCMIHAQNAILSCKVRADGLSSAVVRNWNFSWGNICAVGRPGKIWTNLLSSYNLLLQNQCTYTAENTWQFLSSYNSMCTQNFKRTINVRKFIVMWSVRITNFAVQKQ
jgi:hypothetical protein